MIGEEISDEQFSRLFRLVRIAPLKELAFSEIDLERIQTWTLALLANFSQLEKVEIEQCKFGGNTEARLLKCLQSSFQTLTQIDLKGTPEAKTHLLRPITSESFSDHRSLLPPCLSLLPESRLFPHLGLSTCHNPVRPSAHRINILPSHRQTRRSHGQH